MIFIYLLLGIAAGYVQLHAFGSPSPGCPEGAMALAIKVACFFPRRLRPDPHGHQLPALGHGEHGRGATHALLLPLLPLVHHLRPAHCGGSQPGNEGHTRSSTLCAPTRFRARSLSSATLCGCCCLRGGILPFGTLYIELFFIMSSMWMQRVYYGFGFLFIVLILLVIVCAEVAVVFTYLQLTLGGLPLVVARFLCLGLSSGLLCTPLLRHATCFVDLHHMSGMAAGIIYLCYCTGHGAGHLAGDRRRGLPDLYEPLCTTCLPL